MRPVEAINLLGKGVYQSMMLSPAGSDLNRMDIYSITEVRVGMVQGRLSDVVKLTVCQISTPGAWV